LKSKSTANAVNTRRKRIVVGGYYGASNVGDELLLGRFAKWAREFGADVTAVAVDSAVDTKLVTIVQAQNLVAVAEAVAKADVVALGGGGLFQDYHGLDPVNLYRYPSADIGYYAQLPLLAQQFGKPLLLWAMGLGPIRSDAAEAVVRGVFSYAGTVSVRDAESARWVVERLNLPAPLCAPDPVWSFDLRSVQVRSSIEALRSHARGKQLLVVNLRYWDFESNVDWVSRILEALRGLDPTRVAVVWLPLEWMNGREDALIDRLSGALGDRFVQLRPTVRCAGDIVSVIAAADALLTMRLHGMIIGALHQKPMLIVDYDPKVSAAFREMQGVPEGLIQLKASINQWRAGLRALVGGRLTPVPVAVVRDLASRALAHKDILGRALASEIDLAPRKNWPWRALGFDWLTAWQPLSAERDVALAERDGQIANLNQWLDDRKTHIVELEAALAKRDGQIANLNQWLDDRKTHIVELEAALAERDGQIRSYVSSTSWKITRPLRLLKRILLAPCDSTERYRLLKLIYWRMPKFLRSALNGARHRFIARHLASRTRRSDQTAFAAKRNLHDDATEKMWHAEVASAQKVVVVPCAFEFDEVVNQRPINAAKYFASEGYLVLFVAWQWSREEVLRKGRRKVWPNVYQIPQFEFIDSAAALPMKRVEALYLLTMPAPSLVELVPILRERGYSIVYDIMDDWEEFHNADQAPWYDQDIERNLVLQSDVVCAVTPVLIEKFADIRSDVLLIGNGYSPETLGVKFRGISGTSREAKTVIGYFGHLTDSWFDWELVLQLAEEHREIQFEMIGYGEPEWVKIRVGEAQNIKLVGKVHPKELHGFVKTWKFGIIPFKEGGLARAVDPIKIYEYLYLGLPTFVTGIEHIQNYPMVFFTNRADALAAFDKFVASHAQNDERLDSFLKSTTWNARFAYLRSKMAEKTMFGNLYVH